MIEWKIYGQRKVASKEAADLMTRFESHFLVTLPSELKPGLLQGSELLPTKNGEEMRFYLPDEDAFEIEKPYQEFDLDYLGLSQVFSIDEICRLSFTFDTYLQGRVGLDAKYFVPFMFHSAGFTCLNYGLNKENPEVWIYDEDANPGLLFVAPSFEMFCNFMYGDIEDLI